MLVTTSIFVPVKSARFNSFRNGESWALAANVKSDANRTPSKNLIHVSPFDEICFPADAGLSLKSGGQLKVNRFCDAVQAAYGR
jgi:hypothetical protein